MGKRSSATAEGCLGVFPRAADLDADGKLDLLLGLGDGRVQFCRNLGTASDTGLPVLATPVDLLVGPGGLSQFSSDENAIIPLSAKQPIDVGKRAAFDVVDFNGDGRLDLLVGALDGKIHLFLDSAAAGTPDFQAETLLAQNGAELTVPGGRSSPCWTDINGDGLPDLLTGNTSGELYFYANTGSASRPQLAAGVRLSAAGTAIDLPDTPRSRPCVGDLTGDGVPTCLVGSQDGFVRLYEPDRLHTAPRPGRCGGQSGDDRVQRKHPAHRCGLLVRCVCGSSSSGSARRRCSPHSSRCGWSLPSATS